MVRPTKERRVEYIPEFNFFKPAGIPKKDLKEVCLTIEEVEAIRLKDVEGLNQTEAAKKMEVSRPTFQRVLTEARAKIGEALIMAKGIRFEGGNYRLDQKSCKRCGKKFRLNHQVMKRRGKREACPECD